MKKPADNKRACDVRGALETIMGEIQKKAANEPACDSEAVVAQFSVSEHAGARVLARQLATLNENELKSIYALLAYVAYNQNVQQETVEAMVEASFHVNHVSRIQNKSYDEVIKFLVDLRIDEMRN